MKERLLYYGFIFALVVAGMTLLHSGSLVLRMGTCSGACQTGLQPMASYNDMARECVCGERR